MRTTHSQSGFTLVELSIVLVIIGLIVASVLVGQDLVRQAELRSAVTQYEQFNAAVATFRSKYGALPGDVAGSSFFANTANGDADGIIEDGASGRTVLTGEVVLFWEHLGASDAALINGDFQGSSVTTTTTTTSTNYVGNNLPKAKTGEYWGVYFVSGLNYYVVGAALPGSGTNDYKTTATFSPIDAKSIDAKVDDGLYDRGIAQAKGAAAADPDTAATTGATACVNSSVYNTSGTTSAVCVLRLRMSF